MKRQPNKEVENHSTESGTASRSLLLGATFLALGTSVGLDVDAFVSPALGEQATPRPTVSVQKDKMQSANKNADSVRSLLREAPPTPNPNHYNDAWNQQKELLQQQLNNLPRPTPGSK